MDDSPTEDIVSSSVASKVLDVLSHPYRRETMRCLYASDGSCQIADVVDAIVATHASDDPAANNRVEIALYHAHLPKLADAGLIQYDWRSGTIVPTEEPTSELVATSQSLLD